MVTSFSCHLVVWKDLILKTGALVHCKKHGQRRLISHKSEAFQCAKQQRQVRASARAANKLLSCTFIHCY